MKKTYFREILLIHILVLIIAMIILTFYTMDEVKQVNDECYEELENDLDTINNGRTDKTSLPEIFRDFYYRLWNEYHSHIYEGYPNFTFYGDIQYKDGEISGKLDMEDFGLIWEDNGERNHLIAVIRDDLGGMGIHEIDVLTDGVFWCDGTLTRYYSEEEKKVFQIDSYNPICGELSELKLDGTKDLQYWLNKVSLPISEEAAKIHEKFFGSEKNESNISHKGVFTSYYVYDRNLWINDPTKQFEVRMTYVFHPLECVWARNKGAYKKFFFWLILIEIGVGVFLRYIHKRESLDYGLAKVLTKTSSKELESSMKALQEKVSDWENAKETDRNGYSDQVIAEVDHMDEKIKKILSFKDMKSGKILLEYERVNLHELTRIVSKELRPFLREEKKNVTLCSDHPEKCVVNADLKMMRIVIRNIILEAADYSEERKNIRIRIDYLESHKVGFYVRCEGEQISYKDARMKLTEWSAPEEDRVVSNGLSREGLAFVAQLLKAHNAKFGCEPTTEGTKFWFEMPANRA